MENNEEKAKAQHSTGKHPEPSDNVQYDIETVTPDTENPGQEDVNKHESQDKEKTGSDQTAEKPAEDANEKDVKQTEDQDAEELSEEPEEPADENDQEKSTGDDVNDDVETVSP